MSTGIAFVGCGYVADSYRYCMRLHGDTLRLTGVYDRDPERLLAFSSYWGDRSYASLDDLLADPDCQIVVNLTDPENHEHVTRAAIAAGKHVYSEKQVTMHIDDAKTLEELAQTKGVRLAAAPCNFLGEAVQTAWKSVIEGAIGRVRLILAELDDGMIHRTAYQGWISRSGRAWPARGEFEVGCTFEHAGYALGPLVAMFGPVRSVTSFSALLIPDKQTTPPLANPAPDFSSGCLEFDNGIVARVTNSIVAPYDHRFRIIGDEGTIEIAEIWDYASPVFLRRNGSGRLSRFMERKWPNVMAKRLPLVRKSGLGRGRGIPTMDFLRGVVELAESIRENRPCKLASGLAVHITEVTEILQHPDRFERPARITSESLALQPEKWTR